MKEIIVRCIKMPTAVHAFTLPDPQGDYNVYINSSLSDEGQQKSLAHELRHISRDDFFKSLNATEIESLMNK